MVTEKEASGVSMLPIFYEWVEDERECTIGVSCPYAV